MATKSKWDNIIVGEIPMTGPVQIHVPTLAKLWDDKCVLIEWRAGKEDDFRFVRYRRIGYEQCTHKFTISRDQANELIKELDLADSHGPFRSAHSWRKQGITELSLVSQKTKKRSLPPAEVSLARSQKKRNLSPAEVETMFIGVVAKNMGYANQDDVVKTGKAVLEKIGTLTHKEFKDIKNLLNAKANAEKN
jgi:hypothetical protein